MPNDPFKITGPTCISFSGGRTSAYMLWRVLQSNGGLPSDAVVCFQNTGREMPETLDFVEECSRRWGVPIVWLEFDGFIPPGRAKCLYRIVHHVSASRDGAPFSLLNRLLGILPNPVARTCTSYLKIKTMTAYLHDQGWSEWDILLGIRADEPGRVARMRAPGRDNRAGEPCLPLATAGVSSGHVAEFWNAQPFDLRLPGRDMPVWAFIDGVGARTCLEAHYDCQYGFFEGFTPHGDAQTIVGVTHWQPVAFPDPPQ